MTDTDTLSVYVTFAGEEQARSIAQAVVNERLAACANIFPPHQSIYRWEGEVRHARETAALFKTTEKAYESLKNRITELHSYENPCIVAWEIEEGPKAFLDWIVNETVQ